MAAAPIHVPAVAGPAFTVIPAAPLAEGSEEAGAWNRYLGRLAEMGVARPVKPSDITDEQFDELRVLMGSALAATYWARRDNRNLDALVGQWIGVAHDRSLVVADDESCCDDGTRERSSDAVAATFVRQVGDESPPSWPEPLIVGWE